MVSRRRENTAKYFYDISKLFFAVMVLGSLANGKLDTIVVGGAMATAVAFVLANRIDSGEVSDARR